MDKWLPDPSIRVTHRRQSSASVDALWQAAQDVKLRDTQMLGRLVRWRIPGTPRDIGFDALFRRQPFLVLDEGEHFLLSGLVGRIWTLRRDYPELSDADEYREWSKRGTARVLFASWVESAGATGAALCSEARVEAFGTQGRVGLTTVRPLVRGASHLIGSDGMAAAVRFAEQGRPSEPRRRRRSAAR